MTVYTKQSWANGLAGGTPISDVRLQHIEDGLQLASRLGGAPQARGMLNLIFDDQWSSAYTIAFPAIAAIGGRATIAVATDNIGATGRMSSSQLLTLDAAGWELANHSKTHPTTPTALKDLTVSQRVTEYDTPQGVLLGITGKTPTTFVSPGNSHSVTVDRELYLRFDRAYVGATHGPPYVRQMHERNGLLHGRFSWSNSANSHARLLSLIRRAAAEPIVVTAYTHEVDGSDLTLGVTQAQFQEAIDLCALLGVPIVTCAEAIPAFESIPDAGFEDSSLREWILAASVGTGAMSSTVDTPDSGLTGTRSIQITGDGTTGSNIVENAQMLPVNYPGEEYTLSCRMRQDWVAGAGQSYISVKQYDSQGSLISQTDLTSGSRLSGQVGWTRLSMAYTPNVLTRTVVFRIIQTTIQGNTFADHIHHGRTRLGTLG